jgi:integrase
MLPMKTGLPARALRLVPYFAPEEVKQLCAGCRGRQRDRDALLILVLFQTGLRISEALALSWACPASGPGRATTDQRQPQEKPQGSFSHL